MPPDRKVNGLARPGTPDQALAARWLPEACTPWLGLSGSRSFAQSRASRGGAARVRCAGVAERKRWAGGEGGSGGGGGGEKGGGGGGGGGWAREPPPAILSQPEHPMSPSPYTVLCGFA